MDLTLNTNLYAPTKEDIKAIFFKETYFNVSRGILDDFIKSLDATQDTKETYLKGARKFITWCEDNGILEVKHEDLIAYKNYLRANYEASSISMYITSLKKLYKYLETKGIKNLASDLKGAKSSRNFKKDPLTIDQTKDLLKSVDRSTTEGLRNYALIKLLVATGLRTIEIERANIEDIRTLGSANVLYIQGKGKDAKDEYVILTYSTLKALQDYLKTRKDAKPSDPLFISLSDRSNGARLKTRSIRDIIKKAYLNIGIVSDKITTHSLRHTAITLSLIGGASLQEAQNLARHSNINTTLIYAHNIDRVHNNAESKIEKLLEE